MGHLSNPNKLYSFLIELQNNLKGLGTNEKLDRYLKKLIIENGKKLDNEAPEKDLFQSANIV